jgi:hypothetical protein
MRDRKFSFLILYISFALAIFYPFKGIVSLFLSLLIGENVAVFIIPSLFIFTFGFIFLNIIVNHISLSRIDKILLAAGFFAFAFAVLKQDRTLLYNTVLLFILPVLFNRFRKIDDHHFYRLTFIFFMISSIYLLVENIVLQPDRFGLGFTPPSTEELAAYSNYLVGGDTKFDASVNLSDYRNIGISNRTGGYLANILAMPVLIAMATTFFYVSTRERFKLINAILTVFSIFLLISCLSTTAIIAFVLTVFFYEIYGRRNAVSVIISVLILGVLVFLISYSKMLSFTYNRLLFNMNDSIYFATFFKQHLVLFRVENIKYLLLGKWGWLPPEGGSSHVDLITIIVTYGGIIAYFLYRRMLFPLTLLRQPGHLYGRIFSMTVLTAFICLFHAQMTLNINVMMLVTLLYLKSGDLCGRREESTPIP